MVSLKKCLHQKILETILQMVPLRIIQAKAFIPWDFPSIWASSATLLPTPCVYVNACEDAKERITLTCVEQDELMILLPRDTCNASEKTDSWHGGAPVFISPVPLSVWRDDWPCYERVGTSVVQWLGLHTPNEGGPGLIPGQGAREASL